MSEQRSVDITIRQLLELRHIPWPSSRGSPTSDGARSGAFASHKRGHGTDYDDLRSYSAGDDIRHIDWRASARTDELHTRLYREEKEYRTRLICDLRHCMFTGSSALRASCAVFLIARILWRACQSGTRVSLIVITADGLSLMTPATGDAAAIRGCTLLLAEYQRMSQELVRQTASDYSSGSREVTIPSIDAHCSRHAFKVDSRAHGPTLEAILRWLSMLREQTTTNLWVSGFDYVGEAFFSMLGAMGKKSVNIAIHIDDPILNRTLPVGRFHYRANYLVDGKPHAGNRISRVGKYEQRSLTRQLQQISQRRAKRFEELAIPYLSTTHGDDPVLSALRNQAYIA